MSEIEFINASQRYGDVEVIRNLNLHVFAGEFMVLVGPSGCAKSTTLRMIAGLETISSGDLMIGKERANDLSPAARNISMVFQSYALFPNMSVRDNLSFGLKLRKIAQATVADEVSRVADMLGLDTCLDRKPRQLSGGQAQRVALGRAMIRRPSAFLFDEPLSNLDAELRVQMRGEISQMQKQLGTTTVYVTHDQVEAMTMGDRIAVMNCGEIMQVGAPLELYDDPANSFVAGFIGSPRMNLVAARRILNRAVSEDRRVAPPPGALIGIRPEHVFIDTRDGFGIGPACVQRMEDLGHETLVHLVTDNGTVLTARTSRDQRRKFIPKQTVTLSICPDNLYVFREADGERLQ